jgi:phosphotransferase system HPr (HPr) family protein
MDGAGAVNGHAAAQGEPLQPTVARPSDARPLRREVTIANPQGLHLRPAAAFAKLARQFTSSVTVIRDDRCVNGKSQLDLLLLAAEPGAILAVEVEGPDAVSALNLLAELLASPNCDEVE